MDISARPPLFFTPTIKGDTDPTERLAKHTKVETDIEPYTPKIRFTKDMVGKRFSLSGNSAEDFTIYSQQSTKDIIKSLDLTNISPDEFNLSMRTLGMRGAIPFDDTTPMIIAVGLDENLKDVDKFDAINYFERVAAGNGAAHRSLKSLYALDGAHKNEASIVGVDVKV